MLHAALVLLLLVHLNELHAVFAAPGTHFWGLPKCQEQLQKGKLNEGRALRLGDSANFHGCSQYSGVPVTCPKVPADFPGPVLSLLGVIHAPGVGRGHRKAWCWSTAPAWHESCAPRGEVMTRVLLGSKGGMRCFGSKLCDRKVNWGFGKCCTLKSFHASALCKGQ